MPRRLVLQLARLRHQRLDRALDQAADGDAIERDRRRARAPVGGVDVGRVGEHFERQAGGLGVVAREYDRAGAGIEHHGDARAVDLRGYVEVAAGRARNLDGAPVGDHVAGNESRP